MMLTQKKCTSENWLEQFREQQIEKFKSINFHPADNEYWKHMKFDLPKISSAINKNLNILQQEKINQYINKNAITIIIIDGKFSKILEGTQGQEQSSVVIKPILEATENPLLKTYWEKSFDLKKYPLNVLNAGKFNEGVYIELDENIIHPVEIINVYTGIEAYIRNFIVINKNAKIILTEKSISIDLFKGFYQRSTTLLLAENSQIELVKMQQLSQQVCHLDHLAVYQESFSIMKYFNFANNFCSREDLMISLAGKEARCVANGFYKTDIDNQYMDHHVDIHHEADGTQSSMHYKGILNQKSKAVFHGTVHVPKEVKKISAKQLNQNLMLSNQAELYSQPQLEINASDVSCTHGSTITELDENLLFYLTSRGIKIEEAKSILLKAFSQEMIRKMQLIDNQQWVENYVE